MKDLITKENLTPNTKPGCLTELVYGLISLVPASIASVATTYIVSLNDCAYNANMPSACTDDVKSLMTGLGVGIGAAILTYSILRGKYESSHSHIQMAKPK